ncbi:hypothetical protein AX14_004376, partial [Amanita brunnescens Koide BX004]
MLLHAIAVIIYLQPKLASILGSKHAHCLANGAGNNVLHPDVGCAGMPYAQNVPSGHRFMSLPEPGLVFDASRRGMS